MKFKLSHKNDQAGSAHLAIVALLFVAVIGLIGFKVAGNSNAATNPVKPKADQLISNVSYGSSPQQILDIYPAKNPNAPVVVFVHGGSWALNDKSNVAAQAKSLQDYATVFNIDYRLDSPTVAAFPMETSDVEAATQYAIAHAAQYNGNPANLVLLGGSAGGQLVNLAGVQLNTATSGQVKAIISLSGPTNFVSLVQDDKSGALGKTKADKNFEGYIPQALGCSLSTCTTATETQWSPISQVTAANCPANWLIFNSQSELIPLDQPTALDSSLKTLGCHDTLTIVPGKAHAFSYWSKAKPAIISFLSSL